MTEGSLIAIFSMTSSFELQTPMSYYLLGVSSGMSHVYLKLNTFQTKLLILLPQTVIPLCFPIAINRQPSWSSVRIALDLFSLTSHIKSLSKPSSKHILREITFSSVLLIQVTTSLLTSLFSFSVPYRPFPHSSQIYVSQILSLYYPEPFNYFPKYIG